MLKMRESDGSANPAKISYKPPQNMQRGELTVADVAKNDTGNNATNNRAPTSADSDLSMRSVAESRLYS